jgi:DNA-binding transcriptional LysR family regulator
MNFDTALLRAFVTVAELKSVSRAAERLHRVQSAVSQQIQRLELQAGGPLFVRGRNGFELTEKGEALLPLAVKILALNDQAASLLRDPSPPTRLKVGTSDTYASTFLPGILRECSQRFPALRIEIHCGYCEAVWSMFGSGEVDVALTQGRPMSIPGQTLHVEPLRWVCATDSDVYQRKPVPLALFSEGCADREIVLKALARREIECELIFNSSSFAGVLAAVKAGIAVSAVPASALTRPLRALGEDEGFPPLDNVDISIAAHDLRNGAPAAQFMSVVRDYFSAAQAAGVLDLSTELDRTDDFAPR